MDSVFCEIAPMGHSRCVARPDHQVLMVCHGHADHNYCPSDNCVLCVCFHVL